MQKLDIVPVSLAAMMPIGELFNSFSGIFPWILRAPVALEREVANEVLFRWLVQATCCRSCDQPIYNQTRCLGALKWF